MIEADKDRLTFCRTHGSAHRKNQVIRVVALLAESQRAANLRQISGIVDVVATHTAG